MTPREREIMELIRKNPSLSQQEIAEMLSIKRSSVAVHINNLSNQGYILGRGYILRNEPYITVVGGANLDIFGYTKESIVYKDSNPGHISQSTGGVGRNIAENISRLNLRTSLITAIGEDDKGKIILNELKELGIDTENIIILPHERTSVYLAILDENRDMELAINDMDIMEKLNPNLLSKKKKIIENSVGTVLDTNLSQESLDYLLKMVNQKYYIDAVSAKKAVKLKNLLDKIYFLKVNIYEAMVLSDMKIESISDAEIAARKLIDLGVQTLVITMGEKGSIYADKKNLEYINSKPIKVTNASGAGDAFMSAYVYATIKKMKLKDKLRFATAASRVALLSERTNSERFVIETIEEEMKNVE